MKKKTFVGGDTAPTKQQGFGQSIAKKKKNQTFFIINIITFVPGLLTQLWNWSDALVVKAAFDNSDLIFKKVKKKNKSLWN